MPFTNILFPTDFSERSRAIVPSVRAICDRFGSALTLLHLVQQPVMIYGAVDAPVMFDFPMEELKDCARKRLAEFAANEFPGMHVKSYVNEGDPGSCIAELARAWNIDLIMMPTRGHGRFRAALLGSVTAKTLHDATCPVWTQAHCEEAGSGHTEWRSIICAIDTDPEGARLIREAAALSAGSKISVHLAHAVPQQDEAAVRFTGSEFTHFLKDQARRAIAKMQEEAGTNFGVCVEAGGIPEVVRLAALTHRADLVVIGRGVLPRFAGGLRSQAYPIVLDMPCPVLSV
jgi:nucleotide-binding universal stress UspA family protein